MRYLIILILLQSCAPMTAQDNTIDRLNSIESRLSILEKQLSLGEKTQDAENELANAKVALADVDARLLDQMIELNNSYNSLFQEFMNKGKLLNTNGTIKIDFLLDVETDKANAGIKKKMDKISKDITIVNPGFGTWLTEWQKNYSQLADSIKEITLDLSSTINSSLADVANGIGQTFGNIMAGAGSFRDLARVFLGAIADMMIKLGELAIKSGITMLAIKASLKFGNGYLAIAAGIALIALGTAVKASMSSMASSMGGGGTSSSGVSNSSVRSVTASDTSNEIKVSGEFKIQGNTLVAAVNNENKRKSITS